jgi:hypothetical protein
VAPTAACRRSSPCCFCYAVPWRAAETLLLCTSSSMRLRRGTKWQRVRGSWPVYDSLYYVQSCRADARIWNRARGRGEDCTSDEPRIIGSRFKRELTVEIRAARRRGIGLIAGHGQRRESCTAQCMDRRSRVINAEH